MITDPTPDQLQARLTDANLTSQQQSGVSSGTGYDPTIANSGVRRYTGPDIPATTPDNYTTAASTYYSGLDKSQPDPAAIRQQMLDNVQNQIDAIKNTSAGLISAANREGDNRLGQTRAIDARGGNLGNDFGNADTARTTALNDQQIKALEADRDQQIAGILSKVNSDADAKVEAQKNQAAKNSEDYLNFLKQSQDTAQGNLLGLAKAGFDPTKFSDTEYNHLLQTTGMTPEQLKDFFVMNKPDDKVLTSGTVGNQYYSVSVDPLTGKKVTSTVTLPFTVPPDYTTQKLDDGTVIFVPKTIDPSKSLDTQILSYGVHPKPVVAPKVKIPAPPASDKPVTSGALKVSQKDISQGVQILESSRGADGYVNSATYKNMYDVWTKGGGKPQDFTKQYPPKNYVNPADTSLPASLRSGTAKAAAGTGVPWAK